MSMTHPMVFFNSVIFAVVIGKLAHKVEGMFSVNLLENSVLVGTIQYQLIHTCPSTGLLLNRTEISKTTIIFFCVHSIRRKTENYFWTENVYTLLNSKKQQCTGNNDWRCIKNSHRGDGRAGIIGIA